MVLQHPAGVLRGVEFLLAAFPFLPLSETQYSNVYFISCFYRNQHYTVCPNKINKETLREENTENVTYVSFTWRKRAASQTSEELKLNFEQDAMGTQSHDRDFPLIKNE